MSKIDELIFTYKSKLDIFEELMNAGVTKDKTNELQVYFGQSLPEAYIELLNKFNGENRILCSMAGFGFTNITELKNSWDFFKNNENQTIEKTTYQKNKVRPILFDRRRIPFAHDGSGNYLCLDFFPDELGDIGQIIYLPSGESESISVLFKNFDEFIEFLIEAIKTDKLALIDEREDWDDEEWEKAEIYFYKTWKDDWTDIADNYNEKHK
ncbi:SMI1/KNR4 family protein [Flavobacterium sp. MC2016-06]|uniref:SMI1/KNR4 family protein n=1 Tax=Flavobacterium sp. MC2016-06 TaxID=2676308 RepID=UPI0012BB09D7|nr:SMI1/KNR4 family protein [Flavobacterium sp. MC2016-06]MBU3861133.1 SMI1/KNR4 family protein [Flavobacterium sp. MC2016-06]